MSIAIQPETVTAICVAGEWLSIDRSQHGEGAFDIDAYEYVERWENPPGNEKIEILYGDATGFEAVTVERGHICGPMASLTAVRIER